MDRVILVDERDRPLATAPKLEAHREGLLHRAFSALVLNDAGEILLQQRAANKYHSPELWSNTCCSHPRPGESILDAASRRLGEEMGFLCPLHHLTTFTYRAPVGSGLVEHELDHVLVGRWNGEPRPDPAEVADWDWVPLPDVRRQVLDHPDRFTVWFRLLLDRLDDGELMGSGSGSPAA